MRTLQTVAFSKAVKKLPPNQKKDLDEAVKILMVQPTIGEPKVGDLAGVFVYKFKMMKQLTLLAYTYEKENITLTLLALGAHENFYRDLKKSSH